MEEPLPAQESETPVEESDEEMPPVAQDSDSEAEPEVQ